MTRLNKRIQILMFLLFIQLTATAQNLFDLEHSMKFARYLYTTRQYNLAANEYQRVLSMQPGNPDAFSGLLKSYRLGNNCQGAFDNLQMLNIGNYFNNRLIASEFLKLSVVCNCCYNERDFSKALSGLDYKEQLFYRLSRFVYSEQKDSLLFFFKKKENVVLNDYPFLYSEIKKLGEFKTKKPWLASAMSTLIPGSGKAYVGYWGDAIMSLTFVASNAWISYRGFDRRGVKSVTGWVFGSLTAGFYIGNIWGSGKAARTYNQIAYENLYHEAKINIADRF